MLNNLFRRRSLIEELEPRILFSADLAPFALDSFSPVPEQRVINTEGEFSSVAVTTRNELVIVDTRVTDYETLLADILNQSGNDRHFSVVILDANQDGITQISDALKQYGNLDVLHLITHGESGTLLLGSSRLDAASLSDRASEISGWAPAFTDDADLLLYGCDVASDAKGEAFLITLSQLTGADVAASSDLTGNAALGGNWVLEFNNGTIETSVALSAAAQANWQGVLVAPVLLDTKTPLVMLVQQVTVATPFAPPSGAWGDLVSSLVDTVDGNGRDNVSDPDGPAVGIAIISANSSNGTFYYSSNNGVSWTQVSLTVGPANALLLPADSQTRVYFQPNQNYIGYISNALSIRAWDQSAGAAYTYANTNTAPVNDASSSGQKLISVQVTASGNNAAPTATNKDAAETYTVDTTLNLIDIIVSDTDSGNVSVTLTLSDMSAGSLTTGTSGTTISTFSSGTWSGKGSLFDVNTLLASVSYVPTAAYASNFNITVSISDGLAAPVTGLKLMSINNAAPVVTTTGAALGYTEDDAATAVDNALTVTDAVPGTLVGATISITANYANGQDVLAFTNRLGITGSWNAGTGVLTLTGSALVADYQTALRSVTYFNTSGDPSTLARTVSFVANDGTSPSTAATRTLNVTAVNDAPVITSNGAGATASLSVPENTTFVTTVTATDVDSPAASLVYSITGGVDAAKFSINSNSGVLQFVTAPNFEAPTDFNGDNIYEVVVQVSDGSAVDTQSLLVTVTDVSTVSGVASGTLLFTTAAAQTPAAGGSTWNAGQVLQYGNAGDYFDINGGTTTGTVDVLAGFTAPAPVRGMHYVVTSITIGTTGAQFTLNPGDLLLVLDPGASPATVTLNTGDGNPANDFVADRQDIVVYRPSVAGNYASGEYFMLLNNGVKKGGVTYNVHAISLVETATTIGGTTLAAGTFIVAHSNTLLHYNVYTFNAAGTGIGAATQTSNTSLLLNGAALSGSIEQIQGLHLLTVATSFNDTALPAGTLLVAVKGTNANYAGVAQDTFDVIALTVSKTQQDASPGTVATGQMLFDGSDLGLNASSVNINGLTVVTGTVSNTPPVITSSTSPSVSENTTFVQTLTATDAEANPVSFSISGGVDAAFFSINMANQLVFNSAPNFEAPLNANADNIYLVQIRANDGAGGISEKNIAVTVNNVNEAPVAVADTATAGEAGGVANGTAGTDPTGNVLTNDTDVDSGDTQTVTAFSFGATPGTLGSALAGSYGSLTLNATGNYSYVVDNGNAAVQALRTSGNTLTETYSYIMRDTAGLTSTTTLTITITGSNDAPVAVADTAGVTQNALLSRSAGSGVLSNDTDVDASDAKLVTGVSRTAGSTSVTNLSPGVLANTYGTLTLNEDGAYTYLANGAASRALLGGATHVETFTYTMRDTAGATSSTTLTITITGSNDAPVAVADAATAVEAGGVANGIPGTDPTGNVLTNDTDVDSGDTQTVTAFSFGATPGTLGSALAGNYGSLTLNAAGNYSYVVDNNNAAVQALRSSGNTLPEIFNYTTQDTAGATSTTMLTITTTGSNDTPVISSASLNLSEGGTVTLSGANFGIADPDDSSFTYTLSAITGGYFQLSSDAGTPITFFTSADLAGGLVQFVDDDNEVAPGFSVTVNDGDADSNTLEASITYTPVNDVPTTTPVTLAPITEDSGARLITQAELLVDASDIEGDNLSATSLAIASGNGTLVNNLNGTWTYTPALNDDTSVSFSYSITDGAITIAGSATLDITPVNDAPTIASGGMHTTNEGQPFSTAISASDVEGDTLSFSISGGADAALFTINTLTGVLTLNFVPDYESPQDANLDNIYEVTITASDGQGGFSSLNIQLLVTDKAEAVVTLPNTPPAAGNADKQPDKEAEPNAVQPAPAVVTQENMLVKALASTEASENVITVVFRDASTVMPVQTNFGSVQPNKTNAPSTSILVAFNQVFGSLSGDARSLQMLQNSLGSGSFLQQLDQLQDDIRQQFNLDKSVVSSTLAISTGLSVGYVVWLVRGGVLLSSLLTSMPAWKLIDPLPILAHLGTRKSNDEEDDSLEGMLKKSNVKLTPVSQNADEVMP